MRHLARLIVIAFTVLRYGLDEVALSGFRQRWVRAVARLITVGPPTVPPTDPAVGSPSTSRGSATAPRVTV